MGKAKKSLRDFINEIPNSKLTGFRESTGMIYSDRNFRLDMQGKTTDGRYSLQVQINGGTTISTLQSFAAETVAGPVLATGTKSASTIRAGLLDTMQF